MYLIIATISFYIGIYVENDIKRNGYKTIGDLLHELVGFLSSSPPQIAYPINYPYYTDSLGTHQIKNIPSAPESSCMS